MKRELSEEYFKNQFKFNWHATIELKEFEKTRQDFWIIASRSTVKEIEHSFWGYANEAFFHEIVNRICRITEKQWKGKDDGLKVYSIRAVLEELKHDENRQKYLTRIRYTGEKPKDCPKNKRRRRPGSVPKCPLRDFGRLNGEFDEFAGKNIDVIPESKIKEDIEKLDNITKKIRCYRNKNLAHSSIKPSGELELKIKSIVEIIKEIDTLLRKYYLLFNCASIETDTHHVPLECLFDKSWINKTNGGEIEEAIDKNRQNLDYLYS